MILKNKMHNIYAYKTRFSEKVLEVTTIIDNVTRRRQFTSV